MDKYNIPAPSFIHMYSAHYSLPLFPPVGAEGGKKGGEYMLLKT